MTNKDAPAYPRVTIDLDQEKLGAVLMALRVAQSHVLFNEDRKAMRELAQDIETAAGAALARSPQPIHEIKESDPFPNCTMECGGLTTWCKCRTDAASLAELETRNV